MQPPRLCFIVHDVARFLRKRFEQHARDLGLTRAQWQVLTRLSSNEGIHQNGLAEILEIEPITLVRILDRLEAAELIERRPDPADRRMRRLHLTPAAAPTLEKLRTLGDRTRAEALRGIPEADRVRLSEMLVLMRENLIHACEQPVEERENADA